jgi:hypothetical protein
VNHAGLRLDQAPPLHVPLAFFATAPLFLAVAGWLLLSDGAAVFSSPWTPVTLGLTHLGTLGFLSMVMLGALYQMTPVVAAVPVPAVRGALGVQALVTVGAAGLAAVLAAGLGGGSAWRNGAAIVTLATGLVLVLGPVAVALGRSRTPGETVAGMRLALACLAVLAVLGVWMAWGYVDFRFPGSRRLWTQVHLTVALGGWVGGLVTAVSWQVVPMFYLAAPVPQAWRRVVLGGVAIGVVAPLLVLASAHAGLPWPDPQLAAGLAALPVVLAVGWAHPLLLLGSLRARKRRRSDPSLLAWKAALLHAFLLPPLAVAALLSAAPAPSLLFGWWAIWGWAGLVVHGMLTRIVPFLVWFHRFSPLVGLQPTPPMNRLWPEHLQQVGLSLHLASVLSGVMAIVTGWEIAARVTGGLVMATAAALAAGLYRTWRQRPTPPPENSAN